MVRRFKSKPTGRSTCFTNSVVLLSRGIWLLNREACLFRCTGSPPWCELTWKEIYLFPLLCLPSSRDKLSKAVSLLGEERDEERRRRREIVVKTLVQLMPSESLGNAGRLLKGVILQNLMI